MWVCKFYIVMDSFFTCMLLTLAKYTLHVTYHCGSVLCAFLVGTRGAVNGLYLRNDSADLVKLVMIFGTGFWFYSNLKILLITG